MVIYWGAVLDTVLAHNNGTKTEPQLPEFKRDSDGSKPRPR